MQELTPQQIVEALDKYIVGQTAAKRAAAIAIRNRWRRQQLPESLRAEVLPGNMLLIGPTGVGKTEIARRLAGLVRAPFIKVEATKYTEVGYHGRDVESMVRDLLDLAIHMVRDEQAESVRQEAERLTEEVLLDALIPVAPGDAAHAAESPGADERRQRNREKFRAPLRSGELDERVVEIRVEVKTAPVGVLATLGAEQGDADMQSFLDRLMPPQTKLRAMPIREARKVVFSQQCDKLIDREKVTEIALRRTQESGIIFVDELDKLAGPSSAHGPDVSRQGVQRDLLPIIEGCSVSTRHGPVRTDHILFIAAGAFHMSKPSDLMPELQGRLPIRVELEALTRDDFVRILTDPQNALTKQQTALLATEGVFIEFAPEAVAELADTAFRVNQGTENIGARRLVTVMERLMEDLSFDAPNRRGETIRIDAAYVRQRLADLSRDQDMSRFIL
ncbi:MAG: ATP-dependent protease ATPase subunit HslU [Planctomycetes bacterium]|nr:ATP-dependent protease ATPase subunit HslU [Planctomycetota bacterium]